MCDLKALGFLVETLFYSNLITAAFFPGIWHFSPLHEKVGNTEVHDVDDDDDGSRKMRSRRKKTPLRRTKL